LLKQRPGRFASARSPLAGSVPESQCFREAERKQAGKEIIANGLVDQNDMSCRRFAPGKREQGRCRVREPMADAHRLRERQSEYGVIESAGEIKEDAVYDLGRQILGVLAGAWVTGKGKQRLNNGSVYEVEGFDKQGDIRLSNGFVVPKDYGGIAHGYVVTSHASQGKTVDIVLLAVGQESFAAANKEQFYVSVSRGREAVRLYTDDKAARLDAVKDSGARLSASELMEKKQAKPRESAMRRLFRVQEIQRAYRAVRERVAAAWDVSTHREVPAHRGVER
jgi:hypothetical protein